MYYNITPVLRNHLQADCCDNPNYAIDLMDYILLPPPPLPPHLPHLLLFFMILTSKDEDNE